MALATLVAQGTLDPATGLTTFTNRPPGALGLVKLTATPNTYRPRPMAALNGGAPGTGIAYTAGPGITISPTRVISALARPGTGGKSLVVDNGTGNTASGVNATAVGGANSEASGENCAVVNCYNTQVQGLNCAAYNCQNCTVADDCENVTLLNCQGLIVVNRQNVTYIDGVEYALAGTPRDPFAVGDDLDVTKAVTDASNTWTNGDLTAYGSPALLDAGAPPAVANQHSSVLVGTANVATADEFDGLDSTGSAWRYRYNRRNDGTSGWTRIPKG